MSIQPQLNCTAVAFYCQHIAFKQGLSTMLCCAVAGSTPRISPSRCSDVLSSLSDMREASQQKTISVSFCNQKYSLTHMCALSLSLFPFIYRPQTPRRAICMQIALSRRGVGYSWLLISTDWITHNENNPPVLLPGEEGDFGGSHDAARIVASKK